MRKRHGRRVRRAGSGLGRKTGIAAAAVGLAVLVAVAGGLSQGLVVVDHGTPEVGHRPPAATTRSDSSGGLVVAGPLVRSLVGRAPRTDPSASSAPPAPADSGAAAGDAASGVAVTATAAELAALRTRMTVPVAGVRPDQIIDSFEDGRGSRRHDALDIMAPRGTPVVAATTGRVLRLFDSEAGGLMIYTADESERFVLLYGHLDRFADGLREGATVTRGQTIGYVGSTGNASPEGPHLHFAVARSNDLTKWWKGTPVNPFELLRP
jgi:murein DD-endopeptidase MepM/ murein hydrolase activator NlpD